MKTGDEETDEERVSVESGEEGVGIGECEIMLSSEEVEAQTTQRESERPPAATVTAQQYVGHQSALPDGCRGGGGGGGGERERRGEREHRESVDGL